MVNGITMNGAEYFAAEKDITDAIIEMVVIKQKANNCVNNMPKGYEYSTELSNLVTDINNIKTNIGLIKTAVITLRNDLILTNFSFKSDFINENNKADPFHTILNIPDSTNPFQNPYLTKFNNSDLFKFDPIKSDMLKATYKELEREVMLYTILETAGNFYIGDVQAYQNPGKVSPKYRSGARGHYDTPFTDRPFGDDCSEFAAFYMSVVSGQDISTSDKTSSYSMVETSGPWAKEAEKAGWKVYTTDEIDELKTGDVLVANGEVVSYSSGHHAEIYINDEQTFGWGSVKKSFPSNISVSEVEVVDKKTNETHTIYRDECNRDYVTVYRYEGEIKND